MRVFLFALIAPLFAAPSGEAVFHDRCSACHESGNPRIPARATLQQMPSARILRALNYGAMMSVAYTMSTEEREAVASYLGKADAGASARPASAYCADRTVRLAATPKVQWNGWSPGDANTRFQPTGLTLDQVRTLKLKWAFVYEGDTTAFAQPTVLDGNLFTGSAGGVIYALDAASGCIRWTFDATGPVRSSILAVRSGSTTSLLFGDQIGWFYSLDATTGKLLWKKRIDAHDAARLTGSPVAYQGTVFVPAASWEENRASDPKYPCCTFRGSVTALRVRDGAPVWTRYMVDVPKPNGKGNAPFGPSGAGIWSAPTIDTKRGVLYVTTGDNYSEPVTSTSDAVVALDLKTGRIAWSRQFYQGDLFNGGCAQQTPNCPNQTGPDYDFGSSAMLVGDLLIAGQKSGLVYGLNPDKRGEIVWQTRVGKGSTNGGVQWGMASDGQNVYAATSDLARSRRDATDIADLTSFDLDPKQGGGLTALRVATGDKAWFAAGHPCDPSRAGCSPAQPSAVTAVPGAVFSGAIDGHLRAFSSEDGRVLWDVDTAREFTGVNGVKGHGGSIDGPGAVIVNGMVYIQSGYARQGGMPGNVLLAYGPE
jgi:polyvinyl alcohol dehydrogenase (cytochrome)